MPEKAFADCRTGGKRDALNEASGRAVATRPLKPPARHSARQAQQIEIDVPGRPAPLVVHAGDALALRPPDCWGKRGIRSEILAKPVTAGPKAANVRGDPSGAFHSPVGPPSGRRRSETFEKIDADLR